LNFPVLFEAAASVEVMTAVEWYETRRTGLGVEFLAAVAAASETLARTPERFPATRAPFRWLRLRRFPYGLHFRIHANAVRIVACLHFRQNPDRWPGA